jgi:hypothetical protein
MAKLVVTGTPYSGTHFTAALLAAAGLDAGHEEDVERSPVAINVTALYSLGYHPEPRPEVWWQTRHPLDVARSARDRRVLRRSGGISTTYYRLVGSPPRPPKFHPELDFWLDLTRLYAPRAGRVYRVEDVSPGWLVRDAAAVVRQAGPFDLEAAARARGGNRWPREKVPYDPTGYDRLAELQDLAGELGYSLEDVP